MYQAQSAKFHSGSVVFNSASERKQTGVVVTPLMQTQDRLVIATPLRTAKASQQPSPISKILIKSLP